MRDFSSFLSPLMQEFVTFQKASGQWNESTYAVTLDRFDKYGEKQYPDACELTQEMVDSWCCQRKTEINNSCVTRIYAVVGFIRYLRSRGKTTVKEPTISQKEPSVYIPHAFNEAELKNSSPLAIRYPDHMREDSYCSAQQSLFSFVCCIVAESERVKHVCCEGKMLIFLRAF